MHGSRKFSTWRLRDLDARGGAGTAWWSAGVLASILLGLFAVGLIWIGTFYILHEERQRTGQEAAQLTANLARAFEEHIIRAIHSADQTLLYVRSAYLRNAGHFNLHRWAEEQNATTDLIFHISIVGADGKLLASSLSDPPRLDVSRRDYFLAQASAERDELQISKPRFGHFKQRWFVQLTRRITAPDGRFAGIAMVSIDPLALSRFYQSVDLGQNGSVVLVGLDGIVRARGAPGSHEIGQTFLGRTLFKRLAQAPAGTFVTAGHTDGTRRITSYRKVRDYPLIVSVGVGYDEVFAAFRRDRLLYFFAATLVSGVLAAFTAVIMRHQVRLQRARDQLHASERQHKAVVNSVREVIFQTDCRGAWTFLNRSWVDLTGFPVEESLGRLAVDFVHPDDAGIARRLLAPEEGPTAKSGQNALRFRTAAGEICWAEVTDVRRYEPDGSPGGVSGTLTDVTERRTAEAALRQSEFKFRSMFDVAPVGIALTGADGKFLEVNSAFARLTGRAASELADLTFRDLLAAQEGPPAKPCCGIGDQPHMAPTEHEVVGRHGERTTVLLSAAPASRSGDSPLTWSIIQDISERKRAEMKIWEAVNLDPLTRLPNRTHLNEVIEETIARPSADPFALLLVDLDNFKFVNDTLGHEAGDLVLRESAERIRRAVGAHDIVARLGGDEFAVLVRTCEPARAADRVLASLRRTTAYRGHTIEIHASIGFSVYPEHGSTRSELLRCADLALYRAKHIGRNQSVSFDHAMLREAERKFEVLTSVREAVVGNRVVAVYQPQVSVESGETQAFEALARIAHGDGSLRSPTEFCAAFADADIARQLGLQMLAQVACDLSGWLATGLDIKRIAVNASPAELRCRDYVAHVLQTLDAAKIAFHRFEVEVTEAVASEDDVPTIRRNLEVLAANGISLVLDDFGVGSASLMHIERLPVARVKIDRSLVRRLTSAPQSWAIADAIVRLSHGLGKSVVAEGVETDEQFDKVRELGCDLAQGFLLARPLRAADVGAHVLSGPGRRARRALRPGGTTPPLVPLSVPAR